MDRAATGSELIAPPPPAVADKDGVRFEIATSRHDASLRRLLRDNPMRGDISVSLEREPDFFRAAEVEGSEHQTIIATDGDRLLCAGSVSARMRFLNGRPVRVGYLGGLRLAAHARGRTRLIGRGFDEFRRLHAKGGPAIYLTSIVADNHRARRLLERGLPGMPTYRYLGDLVTLLIPSRPRDTISFGDGYRMATGSESMLPAIADLLQRSLSRYQFAPVWPAEDLACASRCRDLSAEQFNVVVAPEGTPVACAAVWDQRGFKQSVIRGYSPRLKLVRPVINAMAKICSRPCLPAIGQTVSHAFLSHLACDPRQMSVMLDLLKVALCSAHAVKIDYLTIAFDARDPRLAALRRAFSSRQYVSRLYAAHWEDGERLAKTLDDRLLAPEVAVL